MVLDLDAKVEWGPASRALSWVCTTRKKSGTLEKEGGIESQYPRQGLPHEKQTYGKHVHDGFGLVEAMLGGSVPRVFIGLLLTTKKKWCLEKEWF